MAVLNATHILDEFVGIESGFRFIHMKRMSGRSLLFDFEYICIHVFSVAIAETFFFWPTIVAGHV